MRPPGKTPLYSRMLRLRHLRLSPWATALLFEGSVALGLLLALADVITWWGVIAVPVVVALMVKLNDVVTGLLLRPFALAQLRVPRVAGSPAVGRVRPVVPARPQPARGIAPVPPPQQAHRPDDATRPEPRANTRAEIGDWRNQGHFADGR